MYGTNNTNILYIHISPFLKEKHGNVKIGNYPIQIKYSISKFKLFLQTIKKYGYNNWYNNLPKKIILTLPINQEIIFEKDDQSNIYQITKLCNIEDTIGPLSRNPDFLKTGDLYKFMKWYDEENSKQKETNRLVHVVTHSKIMEKYLFNCFKTKLIDHIKVKNSNLWYFFTSLNKTVEPILYSGVPILIYEAQEMEKHSKCSLCNQLPNAENEICMEKNKTKHKKRKTKTKTKTKKYHSS